MNVPTPAHGIALTPEDLAFDRAFREAAERELKARASKQTAEPRPKFTPEELVERRAGFRRLVIAIVAGAGVITLIAMVMSLVKAVL